MLIGHAKKLVPWAQSQLCEVLLRADLQESENLVVGWHSSGQRWSAGEQ